MPTDTTVTAVLTTRSTWVDDWQRSIDGFNSTTTSVDVVLISFCSSFMQYMQYTACRHFCCWQYESIFIRLAVDGSKNCEITRNSDKIRTYSSSRSSEVIDLGANWNSLCNFLLVINSRPNIMDVSLTVFEILTNIKLENSLFPHPPSFDAQLRGIRQNFWMK